MHRRAKLNTQLTEKLTEAGSWPDLEVIARAQSEDAAAPNAKLWCVLSTTAVAASMLVVTCVDGVQWCTVGLENVETCASQARVYVGGICGMHGRMSFISAATHATEHF